jgi:hypothetical protein
LDPGETVNKKEREKRNLVIVALLARLTDFQLMSQDKDYFNWMEELRQYIVDFKQGGE